MNKIYNDFSIGETYVSQKTFTENDFEKFSSLSGDTNPLHHDKVYAEQTSFKQIIVPLHLAASPLSAIAGVVFPGNRSLYLGHDLKALKPVPYYTELTYSAKIIDKIQRDKVLIIRTIIFSEEAIYIEAIQRIKVRDDLDSYELVNTNKPTENSFLLPELAILITGASGEIGRSTALKLAIKGKKLVLSFRKKDSRIENLLTKLNELKCNFELLELDLSNAGKEQISKKIKNINLNIGTVIHTACPPVHAPLSEHMKVNFESLLFIFSELKYKWLSQQSGHIIFISSSATQFHPEGWENYIASKSASENYLKGIQQNYAHYGLKTSILAPGRVDTAFSSELDLSVTETLLSEQVSEEIISITENTKSFYTWLEVNSTRNGTIGFIEHKDPQRKKDQKIYSSKSLNDTNIPTQDLSDSLKLFFRNFFNVSEQVDWDNMGINMISAWDSLRHIELLMALESEFSIKVTSTEVDQTKTFKGILNLLLSKKSNGELTQT
ncbi:MAG: short-subunit dehydrogenase/acyl dehydratase/acyl carrier protein [Oleiphilaceae bacterium]|jgi:short-subunit dehydrogenase/acyl dehydratase/acyl carrier protein